MSVYYQAKFIKKESDGNIHSFTALFPSCFGEILDGIDCKAVREEEREDYRVDVRTYNFDDIRKVWMPSLKKRQEEIEAEIVEMKENLVRATNRDVYAMIKEDIACSRELLKDIVNAYEFADTVVKGVSCHISYAEELWDDDGIIMETELC